MSSEAPPHGTVFGVALNFAAEVKELAEPPKSPVLFIKPENTITGHGALVQHPDGVAAIQPGPALAFVMGKRARRVSRDDAFDYIRGYTLFNDFSLPETSYFRPPVRAKCFDTFGPLGPCVVARGQLAHPHDVTLRTWVNGVKVQEASTRDLVWRIPELIESISSFLTLEENDVIATGFPPGRVDVRAGDTVTVEAAGIGELTSYVVTEREYRERK